jgi:hypothetical protein
MKPRTMGLLCLLVQLLTLAIGVGSWWFGQRDGDVVALDAVDSTAPAATSIEAARPLADAYAATWRDDARLISATMQLDWPWTVEGSQVLPPGGWIIAVYAAPDSDETLSLLIDRFDGRLARTASSSGAAVGPDRSIDPVDYRVDSLAAVARAEAEIGTQFRQACPESRHLTRVSPMVEAASEQTGPPTWLVTYHDSRQPGTNALEVRINALTGEVLEVENQSGPCDPPS